MAAKDDYAGGWESLFKKLPIGEDTRPKDRVKLGLSPSTIVEEIDFRGYKLYCCAWCDKPTDSKGKSLDYSRADKTNGECCAGEAK